MKKINSIHIVRFLQIVAIAYLVFDLLADIMKWQQLDNTYTILAISLIAMTSESLKKQGGEQEPEGNE
ncbi:hypothetical protein HO675_01060 [Streptococcus suis]|nr:hypothetical protein [Streptococcus suis]